MPRNRRSGFERRIERSLEAAQNRDRRGGVERRSLLRDPDVTIGRLRLIPLFRDLTIPQYTKILGICAKNRLNRGDVLCRRGEPADTIFFLVNGIVRITSLDEGEFTRSLPKEIIGKIDFFTNSKYSMTVSAESDCSILSLHREEFTYILDADVELRVKILTNLVIQLSGQIKEKAGIIRSLNNANSIDIL